MIVNLDYDQMITDLKLRYKMTDQIGKALD